MAGMVFCSTYVSMKPNRIPQNKQPQSWPLCSVLQFELRIGWPQRAVFHHLKNYNLPCKQLVMCLVTTKFPYSSTIFKILITHPVLIMCIMVECIHSRIDDFAWVKREGVQSKMLQLFCKWQLHYLSTHLPAILTVFGQTFFSWMRSPSRIVL